MRVPVRIQLDLKRPASLVKAAAVLVFLGLSHGVSTAQYVPCVNTRNANSEALDKKHELNGIRIFYTSTGSNALATTTDFNVNGVPDYVENVAIQLDVSRKIFNSLGFKDPLESARLRAAQSIDIHLRDVSPYSVSTIMYPVKYNYNNLMSDKCALVVLMSNTSLFDIEGGSTPAQRMFRLSQIGYSMFRRPWIYADVSNWASRSILSGAYGTGYDSFQLPSTLIQMQDVFDSQNDAGMKFWNRLAYLLTAETSTMQISQALKNRKYVNNSIVVKDDLWKGGAIIGAISQMLDVEDDMVDLQTNRPPYQWTESEQTSSAHDIRLLNLIQRAVRRTGVTSAEINGFLSIPSNY
jgi:hypothetical protein